MVLPIDFIIVDNSFVLSSISMKINYLEDIYSYNIENDLEYSNVEISYEFDEIKISNENLTKPTNNLASEVF